MGGAQRSIAFRNSRYQTVNFYILHLETGEEVYSESPRASAGVSPIGFESGYGSIPQYVDLIPGKYLVVVNTDVEDSVGERSEVRMRSLCNYSRRSISVNLLRRART